MVATEQAIYFLVTNNLVDGSLGSLFWQVQWRMFMILLLKEDLKLLP
jgi:hypothetical protein